MAKMEQVSPQTMQSRLARQGDFSDNVRDAMEPLRELLSRTLGTDEEQREDARANVADVLEALDKAVSGVSAAIFNPLDRPIAKRGRKADGGNQATVHTFDRTGTEG